MMKKLEWLKIFSYLYLYVPVILFLIFWIKPYFSIPTIILLGICLYKIFKMDNKDEKLKLSFAFFLSTFVVFALILIWCIYSGQGGFNFQHFDWQKHNVLLNDLINKRWPVNYYMDGHHGVLSYYIGFYLIPALIGKATSFNVAQLAMLVWTALGILLLVLNLYKNYGNNQVKNLFLILFGLIFFGTFIYILSSIYRTWNLNDFNNGLGINNGDYFSNSLTIQYTTNITQLCYVFSQMVPTGIATFLFVKNIDNKGIWGIICIPLILYSFFTFIGLGLLMFLVLIYEFILVPKNIKQNLKKLLSLNNVFAIIIGIVLLLYISCNILQPKPVSAGMDFELIDYHQNLLGFVIFQLSWILWILILFKHEKHNLVMWAASLVLFVLPFFKYGEANDFCMRVSIPALFVLNFMVIKNMTCRPNNNSSYSRLIILLLLLTGMGPMAQLKGNPWKNIIEDRHEYNMPYKQGTAFFSTADSVRYQYVDLNADKGIAKLILKDK